MAVNRLTVTEKGTATETGQKQPDRKAATKFLRYGDSFPANILYFI